MSIRKPLIAGNWKMYGSRREVQALVEGIKQPFLQGKLANIEVALFPSFVHLTQVAQLLENTPLALGAQNLYLGAQGAFTGEVSGPMLVDVGCQYVLVGHSERRQYFHEDVELIAKKFAAAVQAKLKPVLCVGETLAEREQGQTEAVITRQLQSVIQACGIAAFATAVVAYEPVWAIGTGLTATPEQAQQVHRFIRELFMQNQVDIAQAIRILYGGSVKPENAKALLAMPDIDGGLVGGASLDVGSFIGIGESVVGH